MEKMKKKRINSLQKGNCFEREVAELFSYCWTDTRRALIRNPLFGRQAEVYLGDIVVNSNPAEVPADIIKLAFKFPFMLEAKNRPSQFDSLEKFLINGNKPVCEWWEKLNTNAGAVRKTPLLICNLNRMRIVIFTYNLVNSFSILDLGTCKHPYFLLSTNDLVILELNNFLTWLKEVDFKAKYLADLDKKSLDSIVTKS